MFVYYGRRVLTIKKFTDNLQRCNSCKDFGLAIEVFREYRHVYLIPMVPTGDKTVNIRCSHCGEPVRIESLKKEYAESAKTPFYLYTGLGLIVAAILLIVALNSNSQKEKKAFIDNPKVGDVYTMRMDSTKTVKYYFLRVSNIKNDTVFVYLNNYEYSSFTSQFAAEDFFSKAVELGFPKEALKLMLEKGQINNVDRGYGNEEGFNRIR